LSNIIQRPQSRRVAEITGAENIFEAFVAETTAEGVWLKFGGKRIKAAAAGASLGIKVTFVVRPEALQLSRDPPDCGDNALSGPCGKMRAMPQGRLVTVRLGNPNSLLVASSQDLSLRLGDEVTVHLPPQGLWILPA
jgi:ABC-type Fe3+/spermidine/putrescine transport system ATPase subunit